MIRLRPELSKTFHIISQRQQAWARKSGITFSRDCSVGTVEENLYRTLRTETRKEFELGDGKELDSKLKKLYSSSALVANVFDNWRDRPTIAGACFDLPVTTSMSFERNRPIFDGIMPTRIGGMRKNPNVDLELSGDGSSPPVVLECKFTEPFVKYARTRPPFSSTYFCSEAAPVWTGMNRTRALAIRLQNEPHLFARVDVAQLIKTSLAWRLHAGSGSWRFIYTWFEITDDPIAADECRSHADELNNFRQQTEGEIPLEVFTWQEIFRRIKGLCGADDDAYVTYLRERYFQYE